MILQALYDLYKKIPDVDSPGFAPMGLSWAIVISPKGEFQSLHPLRQKAQRGNKLVPTPYSAPSPGKRTSGDKAGFVSDKTDYLLGFDPSAENDKKIREKLKRRFEIFREDHLAARPSISHPDFDALCLFLEKWDPEAPDLTEKLSNAANAPIDEIIGTNLTFQISGKTSFVHTLPEVREYWSQNYSNAKDPATGFCLITGEKQPLARLHDPSIKGVADAQSSGASLVSFNAKAYESYGKDQSYNAPVGEVPAFAYCTALNWLLSQRDRRFRIGDTTAVFWTVEPSPVGELFPWMMSGVPETEDSDIKQRVGELLGKIARGTLGHDELGDKKTRFFVLGLSPTASRLSVRFWHTGTLGELITNLKLHLNQLEIVRQWDETNSKKPEPLHPSAYQLLRQTARDADGVPPLLGGAFMRAILLGTRYPEALAQGVLRRIRVVEKNPKGEGTLDNVSYFRVAILKAWLLRNHNEWITQTNITMTTALDKDNPSPAYQLGRLFAVYEQAQRAAHDFKLDRTIRETMFSSASANPLSIFGRLDRLNKHHLRKLAPGSIRFFSDIIDEIHQKIKSPIFYPASLDPKEQSLFCIGYYHQRHELRPGKEKASELESTTAKLSTQTKSEQGIIS